MFCGCASDYFAATRTRASARSASACRASCPSSTARRRPHDPHRPRARLHEIPPHSKFDRKNYPYPDLMKGYQISQYDEPLCVGGVVPIELDGERARDPASSASTSRRTRRGCSTARGGPADGGYSLLDVNRSGVPLMEMVSAPDMRSAAQAVAYLRELRQHAALPRRLRRRHGEGLVPLRRQHLAAPARRPARLEGRDQEHELVPRRAARDRVRDPPPGRRPRRRRQRIEQETRGYIEETGQTGEPALEGGGARLPLLPRAGPAPALDHVRAHAARRFA